MQSHLNNRIDNFIESAIELYNNFNDKWWSWLRLDYQQINDPSVSQPNTSSPPEEKRNNPRDYLEKSSPKSEFVSLSIRPSSSYPETDIGMVKEGNDIKDLENDIKNSEAEINNLNSDLPSLTSFSSGSSQGYISRQLGKGAPETNIINDQEKVVLRPPPKSSSFFSSIYFIVSTVKGNFFSYFNEYESIEDIECGSSDSNNNNQQKRSNP